MKNFDKTFFRMMIIYEHFSKLELLEDYSEYKQIIIQGQKPIDYQALPFVYSEVSSLFSEWLKITDDLIFYIPDTSLEANTSMQHFLGLNDKEFCHLFTPNFQSVKRYGGVQLSVQSGAQQVANNIMIFLRRELDKRENKIMKPLRKYYREPNDSRH